MVEVANSTEYDKGNALIDTLINNKAIKVDRREFLYKLFKDHEQVNEICESGPIDIIPEDRIKHMAVKLIDQTTLLSSSMSFAAGIPGGIAAFGTVPADIIQFYGMSASLAQKLMYLYGYPDMYNDDNLSEEGRIALIAFMGVMLGVSGANVVVKGLSSSLAKQAVKKLPQKALTKTAYYPIIKKIVMALGGKVTKASFAKSVSKFVPVVGGVVSGAMTMATLKPMGIKLQTTLHKDIFEDTNPEFLVKEERVIEKSPIDKLKEAKELFDLEILDENEFLDLKNKYLSEL
ncbi:bacteriochlorophyll 4-vinyl reductase [Desemzia incerta]|uniref:bacteriochlorophyll 4-vinyl reductase n=1 Tax=Desemzia incerta TaxID=82801 RepID=UPI0016607117|nr:bacteriochlorophyll 4-vinyl reductase [Desemzia incerta]